MNKEVGEGNVEVGAAGVHLFIEGATRGEDTAHDIQTIIVFATQCVEEAAEQPGQPDAGPSLGITRRWKKKQIERMMRQP